MTFPRLSLLLLLLTFLAVPSLRATQTGSEVASSSVPDRVSVAIPKEKDSTEIKLRLQSIFDQVEELSRVRVDAHQGVLKLTGEVPSDQARQQVLSLARQTEGVVYVQDQMKLTEANDAQILEKKPTKILFNSLGEMVRGTIAHLPNIIVALVVLAVAWLIAKLFQTFTPRLLAQRSMRPSLKELIETLGVFLIWLVGLLVAAMILFPGLTPAKALGAAGLASVAIGFAFKDIFENFFAGILLLWKFPFEPGDFIECGEVKGKVEDTELRMTTIRQPDGEMIIVPNAFLFSNPINVLTNQPERRLTVTTGIGYGEDIAKAIPVIRKAVEGCDLLNHNQDIKILTTGFGASSIDIDIIAWAGSSPMQQREATDQVVTQVKNALDSAGIEIPFPYRTLTFSEPLTIQNTDS